MYIPTSFSETDQQVLSGLIAKYPLGLLVTAGTSGLLASPIPFLYRESGARSVLVAHMAKANPHWKDLIDLKECLVVFQGAQNYITPDWYPSKSITHKVVPTWNYEVVQVRGVPTVIESATWLREQVSQMTGTMEQERVTPWKIEDAPADYLDKQIKAIIGLEIEITEIKGKWKMSQNRAPEDAAGVVQGLSDLQDPHANPEMATIVAARMLKT